MARPAKGTPAAGFVRCTTPMSIRVTGTDLVEHLWPGLVVNLARELVKGFTVGQALAGREECFDVVRESDASADAGVNAPASADPGVTTPAKE